LTSIARILAGACLLCLVTPAPADALIGRGWLERLSGPGPFRGWSLDARLLCLATPEKVDLRSMAQTFDDSPGVARLTFPRSENGRAWITGAGCHFLDSNRPRLEFGLEYGRLHSVRNVLDYRGRPGDDSEPRVNLNTFMVTADIRVNRILDVGAAIGRGAFSSPDDVFGDFTRTVTQPMRLTTRPLSAFSTDKRLEALVVRFDATKFLGEFTAEDFGARPGTFSEPGEIIWTWSIRVDPFALFWR
jgi:hypothetical protein